MAGGLSFLLGLLGLFGSAAASNYVPKKQRELLNVHSEMFHYDEPSPEVKAIHDKWQNRYQNTRGEWPYKIQWPDGRKTTAKESKMLWWKHIYEDEGVEVSQQYLNVISGLSDERFHDYVVRTKFKK